MQKGIYMNSEYLENFFRNIDDLSKKINRTRETVRVNLRKLEQMNLIKRVGAAKHWEVIE